MKEEKEEETPIKVAVVEEKEKVGILPVVLQAMDVEQRANEVIVGRIVDEETKRKILPKRKTKKEEI